MDSSGTICPQQLDEAVTAADGACKVYVQQFQQHDAAPPTQEDEQTVLTALQVINQELTGSKTTLMPPRPFF